MGRILVEATEPGETIATLGPAFAKSRTTTAEGSRTEPLSTGKLQELQGQTP
jgi:hypothetical protein